MIDMNSNHRGDREGWDKKKLYLSFSWRWAYAVPKINTRDNCVVTKLNFLLQTIIEKFTSIEPSLMFVCFESLFFRGGLCQVCLYMALDFM